MNKKYFFFDIDGTLTNKLTGELVPSAQKTIRQLQENGHFVCIATGRAYYKTKDFAKISGIHHIVSNGGAALTIDDHVIANRPLDHKTAVALCEEAERKGYGVLIATDDSIDVTMINDNFINQVGYRQEPTRYFLKQSLRYCDIPEIYKIYIAISQDDEMNLKLKDSIGYIRFVDVVVFGDDYNDLVMFRPEWTSIAMGNACDALKKKADFVTKASYDDGIEYACRHYGWI